jgi:hypothetical protein
VRRASNVVTQSMSLHDVTLRRKLLTVLYLGAILTMALETRAEKQEREEIENPSDIKKAVAQTGKAESTVVLYREDKDRLNSYNFLTEMPVGMYKQSTIQARYGGGQYRAIFFNADGREVRKLEFGVEPAPNSQKDNDRNSQEELLERILRRLEDNRDTRREPNSTNDIASTVLLPIVLQMLQRDPLKEVAALLSIVKPNSGSGIDPLEMFKQMQAERDAGMKLGQTIGNLEAGGSTGDSFMKDAIQAFGPPVAAIAQSLLTKNQPTPANGVPVVQQQIPAPTTIVPPEHLLWLLPLKQHLPVLIAKAKQKKNATVWADMLLDEMNDDMRSKLEASSKDPAFVDQVISAIPEFQQPDTVTWGREFLTHIKEHFDSSDDYVSEEEANKLEAQEKANEALAKLRNKEKANAIT